ncbi:MAG TPA: hypothetical protein VHG93_10145 [Longimicrobium sp.]|nr:hypothetical protein [Longimicrobium sp.]
MREDEVGGSGPRDAWAREEAEAEGAVPARQAVRARASGPADAEGGERMRRDPGSIRAEDTEPYIGLQYVARLFKVVAMVVIVALTAEVVIGIGTEGTQAIIPLFAEVIQGGVLAAILWGASDITLLLIDLGHDVRAARVLLGRMSAREGAAPAGERRTTPR